MNKEDVEAFTKPSPEKGKAWIKRHPILTGLGVIIIIIFLASLGGKKDGSTQSASGKPAQKAEVVVVSANTLVKAYSDNEVVADSLYKDKTLEVTGVVNTIGKDIMDNPYVTLDGGTDLFTDVQCMFSKATQDALLQVKKGTKITLQGEASGKLGNVLLENCSVVTN